jgi:hypothetical protein
MRWVHGSPMGCVYPLPPPSPALPTEGREPEDFNGEAASRVRLDSRGRPWRALRTRRGALTPDESP